MTLCSCASTSLDGANFADPDNDYYSGALIDTTYVALNIGATPVKATLLTDRLIDSVSFICVDYEISCGDKSAYITYASTGNVVDFSSSDGLLSLSEQTLTIYANDKSLVGRHEFRVQAYLTDYSNSGFFNSHTDFTVDVLPEEVV